MLPSRLSSFDTVIKQNTMGGGEITKRGDGLVVLAVIPFPDDAAKEAIADIKKEFPDLEYKYIFHKFEGFPGSPVDVPAGTAPVIARSPASVLQITLLEL